MHALARVADASGDARYLSWAIELARAAHAGFTRVFGGRKRMCWKMSIDLARPLVLGMGQHDPLDGLLTFRELAAAARRAGLVEEAQMLDLSLADMRALCMGGEWTTADPLGLGGLLCDAWRLAQLLPEEASDASLLPQLLGASVAGLELVALRRDAGLHGPAAQRLAFRELGLAIGLHAVPLLEERASRLAGGRELARFVAALRPHVPLAGELERFWLDPASQAAHSWRAHQDINAVMLATSLVPEGFLAISGS
jgi:hypothetical protein